MFSFTKSQFNKQSVELSILLTWSKYFTNPDLCLLSTWFLLRLSLRYTTRKHWQNCLFPAFLQPFWKRTMKNSASSKTHEIAFPWLHGTGGTADKIELCLRYLGQDAGTVIVLCLGHYRRYHYSYMGTRLKSVYLDFWSSKLSAIQTAGTVFELE